MGLPKSYVRFIKTKATREPIVVTSLNLTRSQKDFLDQNQLNLSGLVREMLDDLMRKSKK